MSDPLVTVNRLYVIGHAYVPRAFILLDSEIPLRKAPLPVVFPPSGWHNYDRVLHPWLHHIARNTCGRRTNSKWRREGMDSEFSNLVRLGPSGQGGCYDTPLVDIDEIQLQGETLIGVIERKRPGEQFDLFQRKVLEHLERLGLEVSVNTSSQRVEALLRHLENHKESDWYRWVVDVWAQRRKEIRSEDATA